MYLVRAFGEQEQAAAEEDEVAPRDAVAEGCEQLVGQSHHPGDRQQEGDAGEHGQPEAEDAPWVLLFCGHPANNDRQKDDVVDAEDDFKRGERQQRDPRFGADEQFHEVQSE